MNNVASMLSSTCAHATFRPLLNIFTHEGVKRGALPFASSRTACAHVSMSTSSANKARGGLPRFYFEFLPASKEKVVRVEGDEFWHMTKVLRLGVNDRVELFNGQGGIVEGVVLRVDRSGVDIVAVEEPIMLTPSGAEWHVIAAFGTLKGGRADWLVEKCTELGASSITPLLTERSSLISENRIERWQRVMFAALKQCQRLHQMVVKPPVGIDHVLPQITKSSLSFLAMAEATPLVEVLSVVNKKIGGLLLVGPEGDFTDKEVDALIKAGVIPVGLGPRRLRVETAAVALLATTMLWTDVQHVES